MLRDDLGGWDGGREVGGRCRREGTCVSMQLIHVAEQKGTGRWKAITL